jgi:hypothetical protein
MKFDNIKLCNTLEDIPIKKGIRKATVHHLLSTMAAYTSMDTDEFYLSISHLRKITFLDDSVISKTRDWIEQIGLIKDTGRRINDTVVYKFTGEINLSSKAAVLNAHHSETYKSPLQNIKRKNTPAPEQQTMLPENSGRQLPENSGRQLPENSGSKEEPKNKKKTSCEKQPVKSPSITHEEPTQKDEGGEGFLFLKSILKRCKKINEMKLLGKKHSIHSIKCYLLELENDIKKGVPVTLGALLSRLKDGDEWKGDAPLSVIEPAKSKLSQQAEQTYINLLSEVKKSEANKQEMTDNAFAELGGMYQKMVAAL